MGTLQSYRTEHVTYLLFSAGLIDDIEIEQLRDLLERKQKHLSFRPPIIRLPSAAEMLQKHPMFAGITPREFNTKVCKT